LETRINELGTNEQQIQRIWHFQKGKTYLCIDERLIASLFLLHEKLIHLDLGAFALVITSGYRSPYYNQSVRSTIISQYLFGKAIDLQNWGYKPC